MAIRLAVALLALAVAFAVPKASAEVGLPQVTAQGVPPGETIDLFVIGLERRAGAGNRADLLDLVHPDAEMDGIDDFVDTIVPAPSRVVIKERDRLTLESGDQRLLLEVFVEHGIEGRLSSWRVDLRQRPDAAADRPADPMSPESAALALWRLARMERLTVVTGLFRLGLDESRQYDVRNLKVTAPDLTLQMSSGTAFVAETIDGPTAVVLIGRGQIRMAPPDEAERTQIRIFSGADTFSSAFDTAFIRVRPSEFASRFAAESLVAREVSAGDLRRATAVFEEYAGKTLQINMLDLSRERWSLVPSVGDLIAEIRTRRHGTLTYARTWSDAEDISFFDRKRRRNIAVYASTEKLRARGHFYSEDDLLEYDILSHDVDVSFSPDRLWLDGSSRMKLKVRAAAVGTVTLRLAESLSVRGVYAPAFGRLLHLRVVGQNSLIVSLPAALPRDAELGLHILYAGRLLPQELEREAISVGLAQEQEYAQIPLQPRYMYSNRSYWYPQSVVSDYATARLRITVPPEFDVVATGTLTAPPAPSPGPVAPGERPRKVFVFDSDRPVRYLSCVISRFSTVTSVVLNVPSAEKHGLAAVAHEEDASGPGAGVDNSPPPSTPVSLVVQANPRQTGRARQMSQSTTDIFQFYASLMGEAPYPSFTLAVTESELPGGHSPAYFVVLNQPLPTSRLVWRNDPVAFDDYPAFFLAHEVAHQWWGQSVGWKNYHEQWLSEGFAQYFATLYAEHERGSGLMTTLLRQMRRWAIEQSDQGPVYLGYRLGHIQGDSRVFRALVYNKGAMVLHMLRRLVGDEAFFTGLRRFYADWRFEKAGTDDFRMAMQAASGRDLTTFFEGWIYGSAIPRVKFTHKETSPGTLLLRFEHRAEVIHVPVTVTVTYRNGETMEVIVPVTERVVERTVRLTGPVRRVVANDDHAAMAIFEK